MKLLLSLRLTDVHTLLHPDTHVLIDPAAIEQFFQRLDGAPPNWAKVYGHGHHDLAHGELSTYDPENCGFRVVLGPRFTPTSWGLTSRHTFSQ